MTSQRKAVFAALFLGTIALAGLGCPGSGVKGPEPQTPNGGGGGTNVNPHLTWVTQSGDMYIADTSSSTVRKVSGGIINLFAGQLNLNGVTGDGGAPTSAKLEDVMAVVLDSVGNVIISSGVEQIRMVATVSGTYYGVAMTAGNIYTIVGISGGLTTGFSGDGGPASSAKINIPLRLVVDASDNLYFADASNDIIRKVERTTGTITTIAGTPTMSGSTGDGGAATSAMLNYPTSVALDQDTNIYIGDSANSVIRKIDASTGKISTIVGTLLNPGNTGDGGLPTAAKINYPSDIIFDSKGNLLICDSTANVIRLVAAKSGTFYNVAVTAGNIFTVAGAGGASANTGDGGAAMSAKFSGPQAIAVDKDDNLYIADTGNNRIRKVDVATGIVTNFAGASNGTSGSSGDGGAATSALLSMPFSDQD
jgi:sugar lactone lactonase YvrE